MFFKFSSVSLSNRVGYGMGSSLDGSLNYSGKLKGSGQPVIVASWPLRLTQSVHEANLMLHYLQVIGEQVCIFPSHLKASVSKGFLQVEH